MHGLSILGLVRPFEVANAYGCGRQEFEAVAFRVHGWGGGCGGGRRWRAWNLTKVTDSFYPFLFCGIVLVHL
jgi:hypothetical protein